MTRTLLVDDDDANRLTLAALLESEGHVVDEAGSFAAANALLEQATFVYDLLVLDHDLGDGIGPDLLRPRGSTGTAPRVVLLSGRPHDPLPEGVDACFVKGEALELFFAEVRHLLGGAR